ncbi:MAG: hypothetical protein VYE15_07410, partial [Myxococcota bacterium]|nr:hypothetical protein [Myxococcota bacterium]
MKHRVCSMLAATTLLVVAGCDAEEPEAAPLEVYVAGLSGGACGDASNPTPGASPFSDLNQVTVSVKGEDASGQYTTLAKATRKLGGQSLTLPDVPEGEDREVIVYGEGTDHAWYARDTGVTIVRSTSNQVDLLLAPHGDFACVEETSNAYPNVVFPATVELGDGRVLITGGFTRVLEKSGKSYLEGPTDAAAIFDPRTGALKSIAPMGDSEGRAGHAMVFIPSNTGLDKGKVLIVGGLDQMEVDTSAPFPFIHKEADGRNDYLLFDVSTEQFIEG